MQLEKIRTGIWRDCAELESRVLKRRLIGESKHTAYSLSKLRSLNILDIRMRITILYRHKNAHVSYTKHTLTLRRTLTLIGTKLTGCA